MNSYNCIDPIPVVWTKDRMIKKWRSDSYVRKLFPSLKEWLKYYRKIKKQSWKN